MQKSHSTARRAAIMAILFSALFFPEEKSREAKWIKITRTFLEMRDDLRAIRDFLIFHFVVSAEEKNFNWKKVSADSWGLDEFSDPVEVNYILENTSENAYFMATLLFVTRPKVEVKHLLVEPLHSVYAPEREGRR